MAIGKAGCVVRFAHKEKRHQSRMCVLADEEMTVREEEEKGKVK